MKRWDLDLDEDRDGNLVVVGMSDAPSGEYLKRDDVIVALEQCGLALDEGLDQVLESLGISQDEYQAAADRNHPGPDPDYDGSSVLDYSRGVR